MCGVAILQEVVYMRRNTLVKKYILYFLQIAATIIKIKAKTITEILALKPITLLA